LRAGHQPPFGDCATTVTARAVRSTAAGGVDRHGALLRRGDADGFALRHRTAARPAGAPCAAIAAIRAVAAVAAVAARLHRIGFAARGAVVDQTRQCGGFAPIAAERADPGA
jgi:hypothetical protein